MIRYRMHHDAKDVKDEVMPPLTAAGKVLRAAGISYTDHTCEYGENSGTEAYAKQLDVEEHAVVKPIVLEADGKPFMVLMHGDMRASTKELAKIIGAQAVLPCMPEKTERHTGYELGGISPFGMRDEMPVYMEDTILNLRKIYINGGRRGYFIGMDPYDIVKVLHPTLVRVGSARTA